jgi:hypothetical protein
VEPYQGESDTSMSHRLGLLILPYFAAQTTAAPTLLSPGSA